MMAKKNKFLGRHQEALSRALNEYFSKRSRGLSMALLCLVVLLGGTCSGSLLIKGLLGSKKSIKASGSVYKPLPLPSPKDKELGGGIQKVPTDSGSMMPAQPKDSLARIKLKEKQNGNKKD